MTPLVTLVLVLLMADGQVTPSARMMPSLGECNARKEAALEAAKQSSDVIDVGVLCVQTEFDPQFKPAT